MQSFTYNGQQTESYPVNCGVSQCSVLGPVEFAAYTEDISDLTERHAVRSHLYADDTQLYDCCKPQNVSDVQRWLAGCVSEVAHLDAYNGTPTKLKSFGSALNPMLPNWKPSTFLCVSVLRQCSQYLSSATSVSWMLKCQGSNISAR